MRLSEFRERVRQHFGENLRNATPENVREFLDQLQKEAYENARDATGCYEMMTETARSYEEIIQDFFARVLELPPEEAVMLLWTVGLELAYAAIEHQYAAELDPLFRTLEE
ncbi:hypothetical protein DCOP10_114282 [Armatimonadetes bacterium DC]|nr:hypothetical protein DCOP10_114282 [Armatimonadetes bacterium DC]